MNKELKDAVDAESKLFEETNIEEAGRCCSSCENSARQHVTRVAINRGFTRGAEFMYEHMSKPSGDDEDAALKYAREQHPQCVGDWADKYHGGVADMKKGYLAACSAKNAVIAAKDECILTTEYLAGVAIDKRDKEIAELKERIEELEAERFIFTTKLVGRKIDEEIISELTKTSNPQEKRYDKRNNEQDPSSSRKSRSSQKSRH